MLKLLDNNNKQVSTVEPAFNDFSDQRPPAVYAHFTNVRTDNVPQVSGHLPNADSN